MFIRSLPSPPADLHPNQPLPLVPRLTVRYDALAPSALAPTGEWLSLAIAPLGPQQEEVLDGRGDLLFGCELEPLTDGLEAATARVYARLLERAGAASLCRIWNYVPAINAPLSPEGLENYRAFSRARAQAFEAVWGAEFTRRLPAASAVGGAPDVLAVVFATSAATPIAVENPEQLPAYRYPQEHGPRSPSFSRASRVPGERSEWVFISGTAAIKGHQTVAPGQLEPQIACTLDNLRLVSASCGLDESLGVAAGWQRLFKIYLRHRRDWNLARERFEELLLKPDDVVIWLEADICRFDLEVEVEASLVRAR